MVASRQLHNTTQSPYVPPVPPPYYYPIRPKKDKTWIIVIVIIAVLGLLFIAPTAFFLFFPFSETAHITEFSEDVAISEGGHFKYACEYLSKGDKIQISITVTEGGPVDVYIMQSDQYEGAYEDTNSSVISFSALFKKENITQLNETYCLNKSIGWREIYVVIDNRDTPLTLNDATPTGSVLVKTEIKTIEIYGWD
ncbi:MAG: hypothetical protein KJ886_03230 [Candidatus Thermoplasmatota archaeon]|nr:hypothetical protein [Candidatus Thermoplasmatota archaeon]